jgi:hypothetical protein
VIALETFQAHAAGLRAFFHRGVNVVQRRVTIDVRFTQAKQVQIGPVKHQDGAGMFLF